MKTFQNSKTNRGAGIRTLDNGFGDRHVASYTTPLYNADKGTRTPTVSHWNLNPARLPIPPHPRITRLEYTERLPDTLLDVFLEIAYRPLSLSVPISYTFLDISNF